MKPAMPALAACLCLCGCFGPPAPPRPVNAQFPVEPRKAETAAEPPAGGHTVVVGVFGHSTDYAAKVRGDWEHTWSVVVYDVLAVEQGAWPPAEISFICEDKWPTPESGMVIDQQELRFMPGDVRAFFLDVSRTPALILHDQARSRLPPFAVKKPLDLDTAGWNKLYEELMQDVRKAGLVQSRELVGVLDIEDRGAFYIFEVGAYTFRVEKATRKVELLPPPARRQ